MATQRADGRWMARKTPKGQKTVYGYGSTEEEADADLAAKLNPSPIWLPQKGATLREFAISAWRPTLDRLSESTVSRYTGVWRKFLDVQLGELALSEIRIVHLDQWMTALAKQRVAAPTRRMAAAVLSNILTMAVDYEMMSRNPVPSLKLPKRAPKRDRAMSIDAAGELLEAVSGTDLSAPVFFALVLGLRRGEIAGLKWDDLDRLKGELKIQRQRRPSKGKGVIEKKLKTESSARVLRLPKSLIDEIDARGNLDSPYICTRKGKAWVPNTITEDWQLAREKLGFPAWRFHDLRHGAAGLLRATGADLMEVAAVLGQARPDMAWLYTSISEDRSGTAIKGLGDALKSRQS